VKTLADSGIEKAIHEDPAIRSALNTYQGRIMNEALAGAMGAKT